MNNSVIGTVKGNIGEDVQENLDLDIGGTELFSVVAELLSEVSERLSGVSESLTRVSELHLEVSEPPPLHIQSTKFLS
jgi:hypothetical protein